MGADYGTSDLKSIKMGDVLQKMQNSNNYGNRLLIGPLAQDLQNGYTLTADTVVGEYTLELVSVTGIVEGSLLKVEEDTPLGPSTYYAHVLSIDALVLTMDRPIDRVFTLSALINRENHLLSVNGSVTPVVFAYINQFKAPINIKRIMFNMVTTGTTPFDGFGDIASPGVPNGIELRKKNADGTFTNYFNVKTNNRFQLLMFDIDFFNPTHPQAVNGLSGRFTFEKLGSPVVLEQGEELQILVQDDLSTFISFESVVEGNRRK